MKGVSSQNWRRLICAAFIVLGAGASMASDDHDRARHALEAGEILPLRVIVERIERGYPGQILDVELERGHVDGRQRWIYEIKVLRTGGSLVKLKVDARDGQIIKEKVREEKDH